MLEATPEPGYGLIPARAGTTPRAAKNNSRHGAHPRSRGDHPPVSHPALLSSGSSPLARGPRTISSRVPMRSGLIPARAGTTHLPERKSKMSRAHPRSRGDHLRGGAVVACGEGSSPLARGPLGDGHYQDRRRGLIPARAGTTQHHAYNVLEDYRLIPARAGTTPQFNRFRCLSRAHPRSRGDHVSGVRL